MMRALGMNKHKVYVVDFFASWCGSCKKEMPLLSKVNQKVSHAKIKFIGVDTDKDTRKGKAFQKKMRAAHALNFKVINDPSNRIIKRFGPIGMPALYIIKNGKVVDTLFGARSHIDTILLRYLKKL
jgi:thiol-disulfide isomerase/thioredoxin